MTNAPVYTKIQAEDFKSSVLYKSIGKYLLKKKPSFMY